MPVRHQPVAAAITQQTLAYSYADPPVAGEDVFELVRGADVGGHHQAQHGAVLAVQQQAAVHHVNEQVDVAGVGEVARHALEHPRHHLHPDQLVHAVETLEFLWVGPRVAYWSF